MFSLEQLMTTDLIKGADYFLKYRAVNCHGNGPFSSVTTMVIAAHVPVKLGQATTTVDDTNVIISWPATTDDGSRPVTDYFVQIIQSRDGDLEEWTECEDQIETDDNGDLTRTCTLPMTVFTDPDLDLPLKQGDSIIISVKANNIIGESEPSDVTEYAGFEKA